MELKTFINEAQQEYTCSAKISQMELLLALNKHDFYTQIYRNIANSIATQVLTKLGPAIDKALEEFRMDKPTE
jgi:hypothetical protein